MLTVQSSNYKNLYPMSQNMHFIWTLNLFAKNGNCFFLNHIKGILDIFGWQLVYIIFKVILKFTQ